MLGIIIVLMLATVGVLLLGVASMMTGGEINRKYGNKLMIARVALQATTIGLIGVLMLFSSH